MKNSYPFLIVSLSFISDVAAGVVPPTANTLNNVFEWGSIGDSYGSGVAYSQSNAYDNNKDNCLRSTDAHAYQLNNDQSWTNGWSQYFNWTACAGSKLVDMQDQLAGLGDSPRLITMSAGGNDNGGNPLGGFFNVADSCIFLSNPDKSYGAYYDQDPNRIGDCAKAIDASKAYIANGIAKDLKNTINDILSKDNIKSQPDFLLYVTGYAQFFNPSTKWCNSHSFSIFSPLVNRNPKLSQILRTDINALVTQLNRVYEDTIKAYSNVRFIDYDASFEGHRFCEADDDMKDQYSSSNVWFWNVSPPNLVLADHNATDYEIHQAITAHIGHEKMLPAGSGGGSVNNGWMMRPFHPKIDGHAVIKEAINAQMKNDNVPRSTSAASATSSIATASAVAPRALAYAPGTCSFHLDEWQTCSSDSTNLHADITMYDNNKNIIGQTNGGADGLGAPINANDPYSFFSQLPAPMVVTGEHENDYIQFTIGTLSWKSTDRGGPASCTVGGRDPRDGPLCGRPIQNARNQMDCSFPC